jgi:hypothetical protein
MDIESHSHRPIKMKGGARASIFCLAPALLQLHFPLQVLRDGGIRDEMEQER